MNTIPTHPVAMADVQPMDVIQIDEQIAPRYRVLSISTYEIPGYGPRVQLTYVPTDFEGWPGGHWAFVADPDRLIQRQVDLQPTVLHPIHLAEVA